MNMILSGDNSWAISRRLKDTVAKFVAENGDLALEQLEGSDTTIDRLREALSTPAFLASKKMVVLRRGSENADISEKIEELLELSDSTVDFIVVEGALDKRKSYYKTLRSQKYFEELSSVTGPALVSWAVDAAKNNKANLKSADAQYLIERVGQNQSLLESEINKLASYSPEITRASIDILCEPTPESNIFDLLSAAFSGDHRRALKLYENQRLERVEPYTILNMMVWQLHQIALAKASGARSGQELSRSAGLSPYSADKSLRLSEKRTTKQILKTAKDLTQIDYLSKTSSYDIDEALKTLVVTL